MIGFMLLILGCAGTNIKPTDDTPTGTVTQDQDGDGYTSDEDCDDQSETVNPAAIELCDGLDNDCNGEIDDGVMTTFYGDSDGDGFGNPNLSTEACEAPTGFVSIGTDCDDSSASSYPGASEECDDLDNDCNGEIDDGLGDTFYTDSDGDGFGDENAPVVACDLQIGLSAVGGDCDDENVQISPNAIEYCDEIDNNCNGIVDDGVTNTYYADIDQDGYGDPDTEIEACSLSEGIVDNDDDCNDLDSLIYPEAIELCDEQDNDCDGDTDEDGADNAILWYADDDGDGYGDAGQSILSCSQPSGYLLDATDCDDQDNDIYPTALEYCNGVDDNCDGNTDEDGASDATVYYLDADGDGYGGTASNVASCAQPAGYVINNTDCNDFNEDISPAGTEECNNRDDDCDGDTDEEASDATIYYLDDDGDGYGDPNTTQEVCSAPQDYISTAGDCDDTEASINPSASEICDSLDNDCDGGTDESDAIDQTVFYLDADGDGYGTASDTNIACEAPSGYVSDPDDCDDDNASIYPTATEQCDGIDENCDGTIDDGLPLQTYYLDADQDGYGSETLTLEACSLPTGYTTDNTDCDDFDNDVYPSSTEICNGDDDDCDGVVDNNLQEQWYLDSDGDGYGDSTQSSSACSQPFGYVSNSDDCDDSESDIYPNSPDICDGLDNDCDGSIDNDLTYFALDASCPATDCLDVIDTNPYATDGTYWVDPDGLGTYEIYCDQSTDGGGWNLISVVRNDEASQVIVANAFCSTIDTTVNCKGKMPSSAVSTANEVLVYDLGSDDFIVYEGFESNGAFGYFTLNKTLVYDSTCTGYGHICGSAIDSNLSIATTSGYTYNYNAPLYQWWRGGGWWIGASPNAGSQIGRVHASSYFSTHGLRNRSNANGDSVDQAVGHQAIYYR